MRIERHHDPRLDEALDCARAAHPPEEVTLESTAAVLDELKRDDPKAEKVLRQEATARGMTRDSYVATMLSNMPAADETEPIVPTFRAF